MPVCLDKRVEALPHGKAVANDKGQVSAERKSRTDRRCQRCPDKAGVELGMLHQPKVRLSECIVRRSATT